MMETAQNVADRYELTREEIDAFALRSHPKALERAGLAPADVDIWELHEAYAA
jgi:acetyl-CoA acetyltransferase